VAEGFRGRRIGPREFVALQGITKRNSDSMPSLKMTPRSGICETRSRGSAAVILPKVMVAEEVLLGQGSRTEKVR